MIDMEKDTNFSAVYDEEDGFLELTCLSGNESLAGKYKCMAKNSTGKTTVETDVIMGGQPDKSLFSSLVLGKKLLKKKQF